jgi:hypothetical protein
MRPVTLQVCKRVHTKPKNFNNNFSDWLLIL